MNNRFYFDLANEKMKRKQIDNLEQNVVLLKLLTLTLYRVTIQLVANLPLNSKQKFHFGMARPGQAKPKHNFIS